MRKITLKKKVICGSIILILLALFLYWWFIIRIEICFNYNRSVMENNLYFTCNDLGNCAFVSSYQWDGTDEKKTITIPNEVGENKVTRLGGYSGRGCPEPFLISLTDDYRITIDGEKIYSFNSEDELDTWGFEYEIENVRFTLNIGKGINKVVNVDMSNYYPKENEKGKVILYHPVVYIECDEDNRTFYSKDGKLYYKSNDELVNDFAYAE